MCWKGGKKTLLCFDYVHSSWFPQQMKGATLCMLAAALILSVAGSLPPPERSYNILVLFPVASKSHRNVLMAVAEALADRGHKVVVLSSFQQSSKNPNILEINHGLPGLSDGILPMFQKRTDGAGGLTVMQKVLPAMARKLYTVPAVKKLYEKRKEFDLVVINHLFNELAYPFVHEVPFITVATPGMDPRQSAVLGNVLSPSYVPNLVVRTPFPMSIWQRMKNTAMHIYFLSTGGIGCNSLVQKEISAHFPDLPPLLEIEKNQSLSLLNSHFSMSTTVPLLPSQVEVGAMHCHPAKPLPEDLESWITGAGTEGVIYFSLGSVSRGDSIPLENRQALLEAFSRLPQRVLWKYEGELEGASDNVRISSWLPQQDILAHNNVKVFISHGGLLSLQESVFHAKPLLVIPIFADQWRNALFVENSGLGRSLKWEELTTNKIVDALNDVITNPKYTETVSTMSASLRDQLNTPQERAVFWSEYVIRHRGAPQLRCPATQLSWVEFLLLDVVGLLLLALLVLLLLLRRLLRAILGVVFSSRLKKKSELSSASHNRVFKPVAEGLADRGHKISAQFPDLPPLLEIERNQSLTLMKTHFSISTQVPLLPSQVEVGAMHCRPAKPLPEDLESWIAGAGNEGVIYFSLGSVTRGETMPPEYRQTFLETFRRLPQRVLWKYEGTLEGVSDNVMISSWLPQQDILAHNKVKVFISHGGLLSLQESIFHATPLLVLPIFGDQRRNAMYVESSGLGRMMEWEELTADRIVDALTDITTKTKYKETVSAMSASLRDQLTTPQERAVFWTEYVIRHRGAPHLRCPATQLSWVEFLLLDVVGLVLLALLVLQLLLRRLLRRVSTVVFGINVKIKTQ
ncbi:UDP-glycosyltransferase UGT5-like [Eriocheir sinensis]|uniref:UDP-glycosyltransferase UGT5-like n=1 Tax=Eriocheir sinensis TaxID=95602 RepID=UPI0021C7F10D|nr:UDP-glycosyltransferase UGT5-like [Eriocheir sinensis]